jgi:8-oxo-dGTP pyrophosphatase MutT (NUDIX family)
VKISHAGAVAVRTSGAQTLFLIVSSSDGAHWVLPKGHIENGETPEAAALRELREEAGVVGRLLQPLGTHHYHKGDKAISVQYFLVETLQLAQPDEQRTLRWEQEDTAVDLLSFDDARHSLRQGASALRQTNRPHQ